MVMSGLRSEEGRARHTNQKGAVARFLGWSVRYREQWPASEEKEPYQEALPDGTCLAAWVGAVRYIQYGAVHDRRFCRWIPISGASKGLRCPGLYLLH